MVRTQVYMPPDLHQQALQHANSKGVSLSAVVRQGVTQVIHPGKQSEQMQPKQKTISSVLPVLNSGRDPGVITREMIYDGF